MEICYYKKDLEISLKIVFISNTIFGYESLLKANAANLLSPEPLDFFSAGEFSGVSSLPRFLSSFWEIAGDAAGAGFATAKDLYF